MRSNSSASETLLKKLTRRKIAMFFFSSALPVAVGQFFLFGDQGVRGCASALWR